MKIIDDIIENICNDKNSNIKKFTKINERGFGIKSIALYNFDIFKEVELTSPDIFDA